MSEQNVTAGLYTANLYSNKDAFGEIVQKHQNLVLATAYSITGNLQQSEERIV